MITLHDEQGQRMFAFAPRTDPWKVLHAVAWSHPNGISTCGWACPATEGGYCIDCHSAAHVALIEARRRLLLLVLEDQG